MDKELAQGWCHHLTFLNLLLQPQLSEKSPGGSVVTIVFSLSHVCPGYLFKSRMSLRNIVRRKASTAWYCTKPGIVFEMDRPCDLRPAPHSSRWDICPEIGTEPIRINDNAYLQTECGASWKSSFEAESGIEQDEEQKAW